MRGLGLIGLLLVLAIGGWMLKTHLAVLTPAADPANPSAGAAGPVQVQQQIKQQLDATMSQPRPMPDDN
jgi:hypothetical protein